MYLRIVHAEDDIATLQQLIRDYPLGILTTAIKSPVYPFIQSSHIPFLLDVPPPSTSEPSTANGTEHNNGTGNNTDNPPTTNSSSSSSSATIPKGTLRGHIARSNPQAKAIIDALEAKRTASSSSSRDTDTHSQSNGSENYHLLDDEVLVLFTSPYNHYVTPHFYTTTKPETGKVVPTWNYAAVQVYGRARVYYYPPSPPSPSPSPQNSTLTTGQEQEEDEDETDREKARRETDRFLQKQVEDLTRFAEMGIMGYCPQGSQRSEEEEEREKAHGRKEEWKVSDAPDRYVELLKKNIIGIEVRIDRLEGKFKMSQEMGSGDRQGVIAGMRMLGTDVGDGVARLVEERGWLKDRR